MNGVYISLSTPACQWGAKKYFEKTKKPNQFGLLCRFASGQASPGDLHTPVSVSRPYLPAPLRLSMRSLRRYASKIPLWQAYRLKFSRKQRLSFLETVIFIKLLNLLLYKLLRTLAPSILHALFNGRLAENSDGGTPNASPRRQLLGLNLEIPSKPLSLFDWPPPTFAVSQFHPSC